MPLARHVDLAITEEDARHLAALAVLRPLVPTIAAAYEKHGAALASGLLDSALREAVRLRCARHTRCEY